MFRKFIPIILALLLIPAFVFAQKHPLTVEDMWKVGRVSDPQVSPDGKTVAYVITNYSMEENKGTSAIYLVSIDGKDVREFNTGLKSSSDPVWSPDGKEIAFVGDDGVGTPQVYVEDANSGTPKKITSIALGASGLLWSPDGQHIAFVSDVFPECTSDSCNAARENQLENGKVKAKLFTSLPYRVWNVWKDGKRSHLFVVGANGGTPVDLTPGDYDTPPIDLGGRMDYAFSPDSKEVCYVKNTDKMVAVSTNNDLFTVSINGGEAKRITTNKSNDNQPLYSPDGRYIAYRAQMIPGFESDRSRLMLYDREVEDSVRGKGTIINLTEKYDRSVDEVVWSPDSKKLYFNADDEGYHNIFEVDAATGKVERLTEHSTNEDLTITPDGKYLVFLRQSVTHPNDVYKMNIETREVTQLTHTNDALLAQLDMNPWESFWFKGAGGTKVEGFIVKPPNFDPHKKYPMVYLVHGGPQGQWMDEFHYRWNAELFASPGYVAVMVNPRGSTGYGQKFTDEISGDWGGKVFVDLMNGVEYVTEHYPYIDKNRIAAAGASYGGYMMDWMEGHNDKGIFKCLVSHDGLYDAVSAFGSTEELWFPIWEFKGTPWSNPALYHKWSPSTYVKDFKTPMLVIHSQNDFRLDVSQGFQLFTALQMRGVPSEMLYFPNEFHFVVKPQDSRLWWNTVLGWIGKYIGN
ncbi:MAG: S9 family peptidase [Bacteroidetes bacterium]|nr:S9 family peptidase [Bacteroidota bacterium]MCL5739076.1 S9 family peptidase [Bacteroidota bacterium]